MINSKRNRFGWVRRRGWVVVLTLVLALIGAGLYAHHKGVQYAASAYVLVNSGATATGPGSANEASSLATTYAGLIPKDQSILSSVAHTLGRTTDEVRSSISVFTTNQTAILEVRYTAPDRPEAIEGAKAVALGLVGARPVTPAIPAGAIILASLPTTASVASSLYKTAIPFGALFGLLLGAVLVFAWERIDPRIDTADDLADLVRVPVTPADYLSAPMARAICKRWAILAGEHPVAGDGTHPSFGRPDALRVAMVGVGDPSLNLAYSVAELLVSPAPDYRDRSEQLRADPSRELLEYRSNHPDTAADLTTYGDPRGDDGPLLASLGADLVTIVVRVGTPSQDVLETVRVLGVFGFEPQWAILAERDRRPSFLERRTARRAAVVSDRVDEDGVDAPSRADLTEQAESPEQAEPELVPAGDTPPAGVPTGNGKRRGNRAKRAPSQAPGTTGVEEQPVSSGPSEHARSTGRPTLPSSGALVRRFELP